MKDQIVKGDMEAIMLQVVQVNALVKLEQEIFGFNTPVVEDFKESIFYLINGEEEDKEFNIATMFKYMRVLVAIKHSVTKGDPITTYDCFKDLNVAPHGHDKHSIRVMELAEAMIGVHDKAYASGFEVATRRKEMKIVE